MSHVANPIVRNESLLDHGLAVAEPPAALQDAPPPIAVSLAGVSREFVGPDGPIPAVRDINLTVAAGEFCVIVGPSGCGKTTLLRMIAGLEHPTTGTIVAGLPGDGPRTNAMVFQGRSVFPWLRVEDNVTYGLQLRGVPGPDRRKAAAGLLQMVGLTRFARAFPHQLSEGMRQRVALARALAVNPDILLMDEPFGALDEQTRLILQDELLQIWEHSGKTVVFITHSIDEAIMLADRVVVMSASPGTITASFTVPFPRPRSLAAVRADPAFAPLFAAIWERLRAEGLQRRRSEAVMR